MKTRIIIDSTADLAAELKNRLLVVPLTVHFGDEEFVDGVPIAHSHPFTSSNHSHSSSQIVVIAQLGSFQGLETVANNEITVFHNGEEELNFGNHELDVINACVGHAMLRAPPSYC